MRLPDLEKAVFVVSVALLAFLVGFATRTFNWPPSSFLDRAWLQTQAVAESGTPDFVAPRVFERSGARALEPGRMQPGPTLVATMWREGDWKPGLRLLDADGDVLHRWRIDPAELFPDTAHRRPTPLKQQDVHGAYLFPDGDVLANVEYAGTVRLDACGRVRWKLAAGSHHSIARADDGSFWIPGLDYAGDGAAGTGDGAEGGAGGGGDGTGGASAGPYPGLERSVHRDQLVRVSEDGDVLNVINVLDLLYENGLERYVFLAEEADNADPTHLNDIEPLPAEMASQYPAFGPGDLLVSLRNLDMVLVVDPASRTVEWHTRGPFIAQHDPDFIGDGWIGVFDNRVDGTDRGSVLGGSRIVAVRPGSDSTRTLYAPPDTASFYTALRGKWQQLPNGNLLLTEAEAGRVLEVTPVGAPVWEWVAEPYSESAVPWVSEGSRYRLTRDAVAAWPCSPGDAAASGATGTDPAGSAG